MLTQDVVVKLILQYIGGAKLKPSSLLDVEGLPSMIRTAPMASLVSSLSQYGSTGQEIRDNLLKNPRADATNTILNAIADFDAAIDNSTLTNVQKDVVRASVDEFQSTVNDYLRHTNILSGKEVGDPLAEQSAAFIDELNAIANSVSGTANAAWAAANAAWSNAQSALDYALLATGAANLAGTYAVAANDSAVSANSSASAANGYAFLAAGHASAANSAAFQANLAAVSANSSAASANSSAVLAANYAGQSNASAIVAQQYAAEASNSASNAAASTILAAGYATAANGSAAAAAANAVAAQGFATSANSSAASANASSVLASTYSTNARLSAADTLPSTFRSDGAYFFNGYEGDPSTRTPLTADSFVSFTDVSGVGRVLQINRATGLTYDVSNIGVIQVQAGRTYRISSTFRTTSGTRDVQIYVLGLNSNYVYQNVAGNNATYNATTSWQTRSVTLSGDTMLAAGITYIRNLSRTQVGGGTGTVVQFSSILVEDITESTAATAAAVIANTAATSANSSAASANASSVLSASYASDSRVNAAQVDVPSSFERDGAYWMNSFTGAPTAVSPLVANSIVSFPTVSGIGKVCQIAQASGTTYDIASIGVVQIQAGRSYKVTAKFRTLANTRSIALYLLGLGGSYTYVAISGSNVADTATTTWKTQTVTMDGTTLLAAGIVYARVMMRVSTGTSEVVQWALGKIEDVTESTTAAAQATIATTAATSANSSAAAAQQSALLSASLSRGYLNANANFADWPNAGHTNPGSGWGVWNDLGGTTVERYLVSSMGYTVEPEGSPYAMHSVVTAAQQTGLIGVDTPASFGLITVEASAYLSSGGWGGSGVLIYYMASGGSIISSDYLAFASEADSGGSVSSTATGRLRKWSKQFTAPSGTALIRLYAMSNYASGFGTMAAKDMYFLKCGWKQGGATEATVATQSTAIANLTTRTASYWLKVSAGAGTATLAVSATDANGVPATSITMLADIVRLGNSTSSVPTLQISNGVAQFEGELNVGSGTGARVNITKNLIRVYDANNVMRIRMGIW